MELPENFFKILTPVLLGSTYFSAFEGGKPTCNRFIINYFLYLLTSFSIYFTAMKVYEENDIQVQIPCHTSRGPVDPISPDFFRWT